MYDENKSSTHSTMQNSNDLKTVMYGIRDFGFSDSATIIQTDSDSAEKFLSHADYVAYFPKDYSVASEVLRKLGNGEYWFCRNDTR
ncbi:MAG: hypothetical protein ACLUSP_01280 [Christensenellales bacterium]